MDLVPLNTKKCVRHVTVVICATHLILDNHICYHTLLHRAHLTLEALRNAYQHLEPSLRLAFVISVTSM